MKTPIIAFVLVLLLSNAFAQEDAPKDVNNCLDKILEIQKLFWHLVDEITTRDLARIEAAWKGLVGGVKTALAACNPFGETEHACNDTLEFLEILIRKDHLYFMLTDLMDEPEKMHEIGRIFEEKLEACLAN